MLNGVIVIAGGILTLVLALASRHSKSRVVRVLFWIALVATILYSAIQQIVGDRELRRLKREAGIALSAARAARPGSQVAISVTRSL
jgi:hypothetical protein